MSAIKVIISAAFVSTLLLSQAYSFETKARAAYVIDQTSGTVLLSKNSDLNSEIIDRKVVRVVTPGTVIEDSIIDQK